MTSISRPEFLRNFQQGSLQEIKHRGGAQGHRWNNDQLNALRRADLDHDGVIGNTRRERRAAWRASDNFDTNGTRRSVDSSHGQGFGMARAMMTPSGGAPASGTVNAGNLAQQAEAQRNVRRAQGGSGQTQTQTPTQTPQRTQSPRRTPRLATEAPSEQDQELNALRRQTQTAQRLNTAINRGQIQPGSPQEAALEAWVDATGRAYSGVPSSVQDPEYASAHADFLAERGNVIQNARAHGLLRN